MKYLPAFLLLASGALCSQCAKTPEVAPPPKLDYDQRSTEIVQGVSPAVAGDWTLRRVYVQAQAYNVGQKELGIKRDTVLRDFATLSVQPAPSGRSPVDLRYAKFAGVLHYRTKTYPVQFELRAAPTRVVGNTGPQALFIFDFNFSIGSHPTEPEEQFLRYLGLIGDNFSLEVVPGQPGMMTWRGLSRGLDRIELVK